MGSHTDEGYLVLIPTKLYGKAEELVDGKFVDDLIVELLVDWVANA
jgi:hypothetical protein